MKADQARTLALHNTMQALASEMAEQASGSEVVATRLAEVLFIQVLRAQIASGPERGDLGGPGTRPACTLVPRELIDPAAAPLPARKGAA